MAPIKTKRAQGAPKEKDTSPANDAAVTTHVGQVLRQAREERELTLEMVADELMIRRFYLECLEEGSFNELPERVYAMGFVRNYAGLLGLDPRALVEQFKRDAYGTRQGNASYLVQLNMPEPVTHSVVPGRSAMVTAFIVLALLIAGVVWIAQDKKMIGSSIPEPAPVQEAIMPDMLDDVAPEAEKAPEAAEPAATPAPADSPAVPAAPAAPTATTDGFISAAPEPSTATADTSSAQEQAAPAMAQDAGTQENSATGGIPPAIANVKNERVLEAMQSAWVEVRDNTNTILFTNILKAGQILPLPDKARLTVTTGNAGGLRLIVNGKALPAFGAVNEVKRNIVLDPEKPLDQR